MSSGWKIGQRPKSRRRGGAWWWYAWCGPATRNGIVQTEEMAAERAQGAERELIASMSRRRSP